MMVSTNPDVRAVVRKSLKTYPWLFLEPGRTHWRVRSEQSQDFTLIPFSPSDIRVNKHLSVQIRRLAEHGSGFISSKQRGKK